MLIFLNEFSQISISTITSEQMGLMGQVKNINGIEKIISNIHMTISISQCSYIIIIGWNACIWPCSYYTQVDTNIWENIIVVGLII